MKNLFGYVRFNIPKNQALCFITELFLYNFRIFNEYDKMD